MITVVIELPRLNQEYAGARAACLLHMTVIMQTILAYTTPVQAYTRSQRNQGSRAICSKPCRCNVTCTLDHFGQLHIAFNNAGIRWRRLVCRRPGRLDAHHRCRSHCGDRCDADRLPRDQATRPRWSNHQYRIVDRLEPHGERSGLCCRESGCGQRFRVARVLAKEARIRVNKI